MTSELTGRQHYVLGIGHPANDADEPNYPAIGDGGGGAITGLLVNASASGTVTIDLALYSAAELTVTGNLTIAFSNLPAINTQNKFLLTIVNGGAFTVTHPVGTRWGGSGVVGSAPTLQAAGTDKIVYDIYNDGSVVYDGAYIGRYA